MFRRSCAMLAALCLPLAGCGLLHDEPEPTSAQAYAALEQVNLDLVEAVAEPGSITTGDKGRPIPCGGLGGNQWNKVKVDNSASGMATHPAAALEAIRVALEIRGIETSGPDMTAVGDQMSFSGEGYHTGVIMRENGLIVASGSTDCLDNPER